MKALDTENAVKKRYGFAAQITDRALCCPVDYAPQYLAAIPAEVIEKDYGCGNPSRFLEAGETVLDLGSGAGKICFIAAQVVGAAGRVIGIDMTDEMLEVARRNAPLVAQNVGYANVEFRKGRIQDLTVDLAKVEAYLRENRVSDCETFVGFQDWLDDLRTTSPLVANDSIDVVVSNCVLNLVQSRAKEKLFGEIHRVLKDGGRAVISDIVSDREVPAEMQKDPELWSGCISGALTEDAFLEAFKKVGFYGIGVLVRDATPWRVVEGIEFRSITVRAFKGKPVDVLGESDLAGECCAGGTCS